MRLRSITVFLFAAAALAQTYPPPFPREGAKKLFENERVAVWDVVWPKRQPSPIHEHRFDQISVTLVGGSVRVTRLGGGSTVNQSQIGSLTLTPKGTIHQEEGLSDTPQHKILVEMKTAGATVPSKDGIRDAFPREGAVKVMENDRLTAWDYTWTPGRMVGPHAYYHDTVLVFLEGDVASWGEIFRHRPNARAGGLHAGFGGATQRGSDGGPAPGGDPAIEIGPINRSMAAPPRINSCQVVGQ